MQFTVLVEIQPAHKTEFNNWYNDVHVPEVMASPGFLSNVRYEEVGAEGHYMAKYEISGEESLETPEFDKARGWKEMSSVVIRSCTAASTPPSRAPGLERVVSQPCCGSTALTWDRGGKRNTTAITITPSCLSCWNARAGSPLAATRRYVGRPGSWPCTI